MENLTRRELLKRTAAAAVSAPLLLARPITAWADAKETNSKVILIRNQMLFAGGDAPDRTICEQMTDEALCRLTGITDKAKAWASIIKPTDVVGIKTNAWNGLPTPPVMNEILKERVIAAGVAEDKVSVDDRGVKNNTVFQNSTALINIRPMRTHAWSGVGTLLKNYIMFAQKPSDYHEDSCSVLGSLQELPSVKGKTRLHILVMFTPQFHHLAPSTFSEEFSWKYCGLLAGFDPVAVDSVGLRIIEAKRREYFKEERPLNPPAKHIALADTRYHLGTSDPAKIELVKLGWTDNSFV
ncbi:MAG: DUF362 domain-containing protein [Tannerellaceae bacterium]|jgi:hypothetical protein|nr:DUF362 domain-containing protein [Tannerellaceae bacterium]